ncbi:MAG: hypothetical protein PHW52_01440 [Candidatus Pacebacteria bacterium]|nr:hypothetical protein [Candidatus Paceibacterota bacterium]
MVKVIAGILGERIDLVKRYMKEEGKRAKVVFGGTIFAIEDIMDYEGESSELTFEVPLIIRHEDVKLFIECSDGKTKEASWLSFGTNGERLGPFYFFKEPNPLIAIYYSLNGAIQVVFTEEETFSITRLSLERVADKIIYKEDHIWSGYINEPIPLTLPELEPMIRLAFDSYGFMSNPSNIITRCSFAINFGNNPSDKDPEDGHFPE